MHVLFFLLFGVIASSLLSASIGVGARWWWDALAAGTDIWEYWWTWSLADMTGILLFAPLLITWCAPASGRWYAPKPFEALLLVFAACATGIPVFGQSLDETAHAYPLTFLLFPFPIWATFRFGQREAVLVISLLFIIAVGGTIQHKGPFCGAALHESLLLLQAFIAVMCISTLFLTSVIRERIHLEQSISTYAKVFCQFFYPHPNPLPEGEEAKC